MLVGMVGAFVPYDSVPALREQRALAPFPSLASLAHPTELPAKITAFFSDNFGGRKLLVREYFRFRLRALKSDIGLPALLGKDASLLSVAEIPTYRHAVDLPLPTQQRIQLVLNSWCKYARLRGAVFVLLIGPNKSTIQNMMPDYFPILDKPSVIDIVHALPLDCDVIKVDVRPVLRAAANDLVYYKWGTHWNDNGALLAWQEIRRQIDRHGPPLAWPASDVTVVKRLSLPHEDSLWPWFGLPDPASIEMKSYLFSNTHYENGDGNPPRARVLAFGDSFLHFMHPTANSVTAAPKVWPLGPNDKFEPKDEDYSKDGWLIAAPYGSQKRIEMMNVFHPNVVILEVVERAIHQLAEYDIPPTDHM